MSPTQPSPPNMALSITIMGGLYFILGFFTWLNGPLISFVQVAFEVSEISAFLVLMVFYLSYFFLAIPSSWILRRTGMKKGLALSLLVMALSTVVFGQFATMRMFPGLLACLFVLGGGMALLQTSVNPYISMIGPIETAAQRIALMGICNKIAGICAPLLLGALVLHGMDDLVTAVAQADAVTGDALLADFAGSIRSFYLVMCVILVLAAALIWYSPLPEIKVETANAAASDNAGLERTSIFQFPHLWLGVICLFVYVGVEVMAGDAIGSYGNAFGLPLDQTKFFTSFTMMAMLAGYLAGLILIPRFCSQERWLAVSAGLGVALTLGAFLTRDYVSVGFMASLGFANAIMWPAIFPLAIRGLGRFTQTGSALLVMGIAGGAIIPQLYALLKHHAPESFQGIFAALMIPCYLYILYFARYGHKAGLHK